MTAREFAQNYYNNLATTQAQPFTPSRLGGLRWAKPLYGIAGFRSRDTEWGQGGQTWPDDDPSWLIINKSQGNLLNRMRNLTQQGIYRHLANQAKAQRWGSALFTLSHELGHNMVQPQYGFNEGSADYWAKTHFKDYGRTLGLNGQQLRRMWRANDKFNYVKEAPQ